MNQPAKNQNLAAPESDRLSSLELVQNMAHEAQVDPNAFISTVMRTCFDVEVTKEQFLAFLLVANEYGLNPLTKEIHGFAKGGKVVPIVGVDGWLSMINKQPTNDGIEYEDHRNETGGIEAITCIIYRSDRSHPTKVTEYLVECRMDTSTWKKWPTRMLRHKATIQAARVAFGFSGIYDPDEAERIRQGESDLVGTATIIPEAEEKPQDAAGRIVSKLAQPDKDETIAPETAKAEVVGTVRTETATVVEDEGFAKPHVEVEEAEVVVEDIPGIIKASKIKPPSQKKAAGKKHPQDQTNEEFLKDLEGGDEK